MIIAPAAINQRALPRPKNDSSRKATPMKAGMAPMAAKLAKVSLAPPTL
jgi:hypothetical protein